MAHYRGVSNEKDHGDAAGFREATRQAIAEYLDTHSQLTKPVQLKVADMYVEVRGNPIHDYIVVLES
jgi:hypothetical protein